MKSHGLALLLLLVAACGRVDHARHDAVPVHAQAPPSGHELGRSIYNFRCYFCHGYSGDAKTLAATYLDPPPRDFRGTAPGSLPHEAMVDAIADGRRGTAMRGFRGVLTDAEIGAVAAFVRAEFIEAKAEKTRYHTTANGWPDHDRYRAAFPFARGEIALDAAEATLDPLQEAGRSLFMTTCISCHDRARVTSDGAVWETQPLSFPRNGRGPGSLYTADAAAGSYDTLSGASPYRVHDRAPVLDRASAAERRGEALFQKNCAFCHAADGTGRNWIGAFLEPHPRDLTSDQAMRDMTRARLAATVAEGLPQTSMPAWKDVLAPDEIGAIVAYVARAFHPLAD